MVNKRDTQLTNGRTIQSGGREGRHLETPRSLFYESTNRQKNTKQARLDTHIVNLLKVLAVTNNKTIKALIEEAVLDRYGFDFEDIQSDIEKNRLPKGNR